AMQGAGLDPDSVLRFLLFEPTAPRSVRCGVLRIAQYLERLPAVGAATEARRVIGRLEAHLHYDADEILAKQRAVDFCANVSRQLATAHDAVNRGFFRG
ncbi:MAG: alpha-E domain-containing protein, partial [Myxococcota bacterium]